MDGVLEKLNDRQREAVMHTDGPLLILAGAGSGKTRVITNRIAYLIEEKGVPARSILAITFTNKAAQEMRERVEDMLGMDAGGAWICTFHSACVRILRSYGHLLGYDDHFTIYDRDDQLSLVKSICRNLNLDTKQFKEKMFISRISQAKDRLISPADYLSEFEENYYTKRVALVYETYQRELLKNNAMDFDDLIVNAVKLFRKEPEVLSRYQDRFRYISVDEYQDTNMAQFELIKALGSAYGNVCVVGDDDQSIYKFRGANIENILSFEKTFKGAKVIRLEQNYRSTKTILNAANAVIGKNTQRKAKTLWTENEEGGRVRLFETDNPYVEASIVAREVTRLKAAGCGYKDMACLYRTNAQSRILEEMFIRENIPYKIVGGVNFYQRKEIKDILAYLYTIDNAKDDVAVKRIINVPKRGIGAAAVNAVAALAAQRDIRFYSALECGITEGIFAGKAAEKLRGFLSLIEELKEEAEENGVSDLIDLVLDKSGYLDELKNEDTDEAKARIENIDELLSKAKSYEENASEPSLSGFLAEVSLVSDIDSWDSAEDYVSLITVHSAKGLEFSHVFLCGMEDGLFPMNASIASDDPADLEEERRLAYVAITRAKKSLTLTAARVRMVRGETMPSVLSRFVKEIPPLLIEHDAGFYMNGKKVGGGARYREERLPVQKAASSGRAKPGGYGAAKRYASFGKASGGGKAPLEYKTGDRVLSVRFGEGIVTAIEDGGRDWEVTVDFDDAGVRKMFAGFAHLQPAE